MTLLYSYFTQIKQDAIHIMRMVRQCLQLQQNRKAISRVSWNEQVNYIVVITFEETREYPSRAHPMKKCRSVAKKGPWAVHLTLCSDKGVGGYL